MSNSYNVELPKAVWGIKITQMVLSFFMLALAAFIVWLNPFNRPILATFTATFSIIVLAYYFASLHVFAKTYNWIALLVLEIITLIFWLAAWVIFALQYDVFVHTVSDGNMYVVYLRRRDSEGLAPGDPRDASRLAATYNGTLLAGLGLALVNFILFCVTLGLMSKAIHCHRRACRSNSYDGCASSHSDTEKANSIATQKLSDGTESLQSDD